MNSNNQKGVVIAEILEKYHRKKKTGETFWMLKLSVRKALTQAYFELVDKTQLTLKIADEPVFVFTEKGRFSNTLLPGNIYFLEFVMNSQKEKNYCHLENWIKLGDDKRIIERTFRLLINEGTRKKSEKRLTNQELLQELEKRMRLGKIIFELEANNKGSAKILENTGLGFDFELKDKDSNFSLDLRKNEDEKLAGEFLKKHNWEEIAEESEEEENGSAES